MYQVEEIIEVASVAERDEQEEIVADQGGDYTKEDPGSDAFY
jgi:hypothetical protein